MSMHAYVLHGIEDLRLEKRPKAQLGPREVRVEVRRVGICASDTHSYSHYRIGEFVPHKPHVLGHEFSGT